MAPLRRIAGMIFENRKLQPAAGKQPCAYGQAESLAPLRPSDPRLDERSLRPSAEIESGIWAWVTQSKSWVNQWKTLRDPVENSA